MEEVKSDVYTYDRLNKIFNDYDIVTVVFTKKNGDERVMTCTRKNTFMPEDKRPKDKDKDGDSKPISETTFTVYEIGVGWRSFGMDKIISLTKYAVCNANDLDTEKETGLGVGDIY